MTHESDMFEDEKTRSRPRLNSFRTFRKEDDIVPASVPMHRGASSSRFSSTYSGATSRNQADVAAGIGDPIDISPPSLSPSLLRPRMTSCSLQEDIRESQEDCRHCEKLKSLLGELQLEKFFDEELIQKLRHELEVARTNGASASASTSAAVRQAFHDEIGDLKAQLFQSEDHRRHSEAHFEKERFSIQSHLQRVIDELGEEKACRKHLEEDCWDLQLEKKIMFRQMQEIVVQKSEIEKESLDLKRQIANLTDQLEQAKSIRTGMLCNSNAHDIDDNHAQCLVDIDLTESDQQMGFVDEPEVSTLERSTPPSPMNDPDVNRTLFGLVYREESGRTSELPQVEQDGTQTTTSALVPSAPFTIRYGSTTHGFNAPLKGNLQILDLLKWGARDETNSVLPDDQDDDYEDDSDESIDGGETVGMKRKRVTRSQKAKKAQTKRSTADIGSFSSELQESLQRLKKAFASATTTRRPGRFPINLKPKLMQVTIEAIILGEYDDKFFDFMSTTYPFDNPTITTLIKQMVFNDHLKLLTDRKEALLDELKCQIDKKFPKVKADWEKSVQATDSDSDSGQDSEPSSRPRYFPWNDNRRAILWELVLIVNECHRLQWEKTQLEESQYTGLAVSRSRGRLYDEILRKFPDEWMTKFRISTEVSAIKRKLEKKYCLRE
ncbi:hypothetical protein GYMLUDRAFT_43042 [Collybiopsis luxurians FD-317 M1]|uniref:Ubinuclein middle domain-containing protein n=1 Tax=Collybiopsis luxurians FD-317 M1 TaxID=944289 RepID=A0A0D0BCR3_9AGAR|nr:hypothetical protein GYMLUDRAFT_43042 [Collybiopsis luxurians FD-317 M1]